MPTITFRLDDAEAEELRRKADIAGRSVSDYIRLAIGVHTPDPAERLENLEAYLYDGVERRLTRLERLAEEATQ